MISMNTRWNFEENNYPLEWKTLNKKHSGSASLYHAYFEERETMQTWPLKWGKISMQIVDFYLVTCSSINTHVYKLLDFEIGRGFIIGQALAIRCLCMKHMIIDQSINPI